MFDEVLLVSLADRKMFRIDHPWVSLAAGDITFTDADAPCLVVRGVESGEYESMSVVRLTRRELAEIYSARLFVEHEIYTSMQPGEHSVRTSAPATEAQPNR